MRFIRGNSYNFIVIGLIATGYGIYLIKRGTEGDRLLAGTLFTYVPRWIFILIGLLLQFTASSRDLVSFYNPGAETRLNRGTADCAD